jgi:hypothetical protein
MPRFISGSGSVTLTAPPAGQVIVIDWIAAMGDDDATPSPMLVQVTGDVTINLAREPGDGLASHSRNIFMPFPNGLVMWGASDSNSSVASTVNVVNSIAGGSNVLTCVGYHHAPISQMRN